MIDHRPASRRNLGYSRTEVTCSCGGTYWFGEHEGDPPMTEARDAHAAASERLARYAEAIYLASDPCGCETPTPWAALSASRQEWFLSVVTPPILALVDAERAAVVEPPP